MSDRPLRICFVAYRGNMRCGGQGVYLWFLARELARMGCEVEVFVGPPYPDEMPFAQRVHHVPNQEFWARWFTRDYVGMLPDGAPLRVLSPLNLYELGASLMGFLPEPFAFSCRAFGAMARRLREGARWDLVHDVQCLGWGLLAVRALGLPIATTVHHPLSVDRRASFVRDQTTLDAIGTAQFYPIGMQSFVARRIDKVFTSSEASALEIARDFGVSPDRISNVWNGIDTDLYSPDEGVESGRTELLCVGRSVDPNKGVKTLIRALALLPESSALTLVDDDHRGNPVFDWARKAGVGERVNVVGRVSTDELVHLYRRAALVVVPSRYEGFGLPAVEAMACGTPVVACAAGALSEVMRVAPGGLVVPRDDPEGLAKGILTLIEQPDIRARLGRLGRERVVAHFSWARVAAATAEGYAEVIADRRGRPARSTTSAIPGTRRATRSSA